MQPTNSIKNGDLEERKANGLCLWCDEKLILRHGYKNQKLNSLCIVDD